MKKLFIFFEDLEYARRFIPAVEKNYGESFEIVKDLGQEKLREKLEFDKDSLLLTDSLSLTVNNRIYFYEERKEEKVLGGFAIFKYQGLDKIFSQIDKLINDLAKRTRIINLINLDFTERSRDYNEGLYRRLSEDNELLVLRLNQIEIMDISDEEVGLEALVMSAKIGGDIKKEAVVNKGRHYDYINTWSNPDLFYRLGEKNISNIIRQVKAYEYNLVILEFNFSFFNNFLILVQQADKNIIKTIYRPYNYHLKKEISFLEERGILSGDFSLFHIDIKDLEKSLPDLNKSEGYKKILGEVVDLVSR